MVPCLVGKSRVSFPFGPWMVSFLGLKFDNGIALLASGCMVGIFGVQGWANHLLS